MKKDINLRTGDFLLPQQIYLRRLFSVILISLLAAGFLIAVIFLNVYRNQLEDRYAELAEKREEIRISAVPLKEKERETALLREKIESEEQLRNKKMPWTDYIRDIIAAAGAETEVMMVSGNAAGSILVDGQAPSLEAIAAYTRMLEQLHYMEEAVFERMDYMIARNGDDQIPPYESDESFYYFSVYGTLANN